MYFFAPRRRKNRNGETTKRSRDGSSTWESTAKVIKLRNRYGQLIGEKRLLEYKIGQAKTKTPWRIHEYRLAGVYSILSSAVRKGKDLEFLDLVLCRLFMSKREPGGPDVAPEEEGGYNHGFYEEEQNHYLSLSSGSSSRHHVLT